MSPTLFGIKSGKRVEVIIDGSHIYDLSRLMECDVDFLLLRQLIFNEYDCRRMAYVMKVAYNDDGGIRHPNVARMLDFLRYNGFLEIRADIQERTHTDGRRSSYSNVAVPITCQMLVAAATGIDEIILFAGSEDLVPAVLAAQQLGARVTLVSSKIQSNMLSNELRGVCDWFVELDTFKDKIKRVRDPHAPDLPNVVTAGEAVVVQDRRDAALGTRARIGVSRRS